MSRVRKPAPVEADSTKPAPANETRFTLEQLKAAALPQFGISQSTFDAATAQLQGMFTLAKASDSKPAKTTG